MNALEISNLVIKYKTDDGIVSAVNELDLIIGKGMTLGLVGETGAGKTTTALSILNLVPNPPGIIESGIIKFEDQNILDLNEKELEKIRGHKISMIFQDPMTSLNPVLTVEDQIAEVIALHMNLSYKESIVKAREMLEMVDIQADRGVEYPHQFSGGMKQRVVIAMALACNPSLLIADEPTTALDVTIQAQVLEMMKSLKKNYDTSILMITHDLGIIAEMCDMVAVIYAGRIVEFGNLYDVYENTKHPYTEGLFNSLPDIKNRNNKLKPIKGLMPDPYNLPNGCPFHPRCEYATDICAKEKPRRIYANESHYVECHLYNDDNINNGKVINR